MNSLLANHALFVIGLVIVNSIDVYGEESHSLHNSEEVGRAAVAKWSAREKSMFDMIVAGQEVNLWPDHKDHSDIDNLNWGQDQKISGKFVRDILTIEALRSQIPVAGVTIIGAWFSEAEGLDLSHAQLSTRIELDSCKIDGPCEFSYSASKEDITLSSCCGRNVKAIGFSGVNFRMTLGKWSRQLLFLKATVGQLDFNGVRSDKLWLVSCKINDYLHINGNIGEIIVQRTTASDDISLANLDAKFTLDQVEISRDLKVTNCIVMPDSSWHNIHVVGTLILANRIGPLLDLSYVRVDRDVDLTSLQEAGTIDLTGAAVGRSLNLYRDTRNPELTRLPWQGSAKLVLAEAKVGFVSDERNFWPRQLDISDFVYGRWRPHDDGELKDRWKYSKGWFFNWLEKQKYSAESYNRLAAAFSDLGMQEAATEVLFRSKQREREEAGIFSRFLSTVSWVLTGYGYHYEFSLFWCLGFVVVGGIILRCSSEGRSALVHPQFGRVDVFFYSLDAFLPFIELRKGFDAIDFQSWVKYYFYVHRLAGYIIGSFIIAGLAGLYK